LVLSREQDRDSTQIFARSAAGSLPRRFSKRANWGGIRVTATDDSIPQVVEANTPRQMDAAGECSLYDGYKDGNHA